MKRMLAWVVWPDTRSVTIHRRAQPPRTLHEQDAIPGDEIIPGFQCAVTEFFAD